MISYYTQIQVNQTFNSEILISMFLDWLSNSKNKIEHLNYKNQSSFEYKEDRKSLKIEDFHEYHILGIQFITSDNYKKAQFIVEIMYDYMNQTLDLGFYKELNLDSKYISAISLPKIFINLLNSNYILKDSYLKIQNIPYYRTYKEVNQLLKENHQYPLILLTRNEKCIVHPVKLSEKLYGIGHVICIKNQKDTTMEIVYPNHDIERIENELESKMIAICYEKVLNYSIQEHTQNYMFDELVQARLLQEKQSTDELETFYQSEVEINQKEVKEYEELYKQTKLEYEQLLKRKEELNEYLKSINQQVILTMSSNNMDKQQLLLDIVNKAYQSIPKNKKYRKKDILASIIKENCK